MSPLIHAAGRGVQGVPSGVLDEVLTMECGINSGSQCKADKLWPAVKHILQCTDAEAADILEVQVMNVDEDEEYAKLLTSEAADDVIEKGDKDLVNKFCENIEDTKKDSDALTKRIRQVRQSASAVRATKFRPAISLQGSGWRRWRRSKACFLQTPSAGAMTTRSGGKLFWGAAIGMACVGQHPSHGD